MPLYPNVVLDLSVVTNSPMPIVTLIGRTVRLMRDANIDEDAIEAYTDDVHYATFDHALEVTRLTITVKE